MNRRAFIQAVMSAAVAAYVAPAELVPQTRPESSSLFDALPDRFSARLWIEDADGRALTQHATLRMRRTAPGHWRQEGEFSAWVIETGTAARLCCDVDGHLTHFQIGGDGLQLDNNNLTTGGALSIVAAQLGPNSS